MIDTDKNEQLHIYPVKLADRAYPLAVDEAHHGLFLGCRNKPSLVVVDSENGKEIASVAIPTAKLARTCYFDPAGGRLYLVVPRQEGEEGPTIRVFRPRP